MENKKLTYISLFSGGGIGCYGFKMENFECIATVELLKKRLEIQKINNKCYFESGYINENILLSSTKNKIYSEIELWKSKKGISNVDVLIATPPCQGMSTVNSKKNKSDLFRNSLVVESIEIIENIKPNFFIFENVPSFMKTNCISKENNYKIGDYLYQKLSKNYSIYHDVINFKEYGIPSSRNRCLVIGVKNNLSNFISPIEIFPDFISNLKTMKKVIYDLPRLSKMGEIDAKDIYHFYRPYEERMRAWISGLKEGQSAYENTSTNLIPHKIIDGKIILNKNQMGGKYKRQEWNQVAKCIHTRNDQLASQNTIHPVDDRVFSIRELMIFMSVPKSFKWSSKSLNKLNSLNECEKKEFLKKNELNIRQILGEAVPTLIFKNIAKKINHYFNDIYMNNMKDIISYELENPNRIKNAAFYTNKFIVSEIIKNLPDFNNCKSIRILEPSVGMGSFLFLLFKKYQKIKKVEIDVIDIDKNTLQILKNFLKHTYIPKNITIKYYCDDFLTKKFNKKNKYDLVLGNPPFQIIKDKDYVKNLNNIFGKQSNKNTITYFILKSMEISNLFSFVLPKNFLLAPQYNEIRKKISELKITDILDFESLGFDNVIMETIAIIIANKYSNNNEINVSNLKTGKKIIQNKNYIISSNFPNWVIYRNNYFDEILYKMIPNIFDVFRDRQITNRYLNSDKKGIRVIRSRNINVSGELINIDGYDKYVDDLENIKKMNVFKFMNDYDSYICPNFTTNIRVIPKPKNTLANGSVAIFSNKTNINLLNSDIKWFSTEEFKKFYRISNNFQKNTINLDKNSIFYFGIIRDNSNITNN